VPGGYSAQAVRPIALRQVMEVGRKLYGRASISGIGGIETAYDAIQFIALGASTVQICTGAMLRGFEIIGELTADLSKWMDEKGFDSIEAFRGKALDYFTTHADLVQRQKEARRSRAGERSRDDEWSGDKIREQTAALTSE
jgi:hypothetical protein